jgi:hypothetical protein
MISILLTIIIVKNKFYFYSHFNVILLYISSGAQSSSVWREVAKASAERERALERLTPSATS